MSDDKDELFRMPPNADEKADEGAHEAPSASSYSHAGEPEAAAAADSEVHAAPGPTKIEKVKTPSRGPVLLAAVVLGALSGFGGAYALRYVDALQGPDREDRVATVDARADDLERKSDAEASALAGLQNRVAAAESNAAKAAASVGDLRKSIESRPVAAASGSPAAAPDLAPLQSQISGLEEKLGGLATALAAQKEEAARQHVEVPDIHPVESAVGAVQSEVGTVEKKIAAIEAALAAPKEDAHAKALLAAHSQGVVAAGLVQAITRGEPFAADVAALENLGVDPGKLAPLRAAAKTGVASYGALADQFAAIAPSLEDPEPPKPDLSVLDRLARDASNLVHIRRAGNPNDVDLPGEIAAIENALAHLDVAKAYAIWQTLPDAAKVRSASWAAAAKTRLDALAAANAIEADAVSAVAKPKS